MSKSFGVYLFFRGHGCQGNPIYIGKAGSFSQDGTPKSQGVAKRLTMKQDGVLRKQFFLEYMEEISPGGLSFEWYVTYEGGNTEYPTLAEAKLLAAYFDDNGQLPELNKSF